MAKEDEERLLRDEYDDCGSESGSDGSREFDKPEDALLPREGYSRARNITIVCFLSLLLITAAFRFSDIWKTNKSSNSAQVDKPSPTTEHHDSKPTAVSQPNASPTSLLPGGGDTVDTGKHSGPVQSPSDYILSKDWNFDDAPTRREFHWTITDAEFNPDGVYRPMMVINNQFPGPLIRANEGDTIVVHVHNQAANATSFHWHGIYQNGTAWMDGSVGISQCPISPGGSFVYEFQVRGQFGTYWYHAHQGAQSSDGLVGPMVIHSKEERRMESIPYETDQVVMLSDHYHNLTSELMMKYLASGAENAEPVPDGALINGRGRKDCTKFPGWRCDDTSPHVGYPRFELDHGKDHKLRFINVGAFAEFQVAIDDHNFAVVEVDGTPVKPRYYDRFSSNSAQRYSIILPANRTEGAHWMRAKMLSACFTDPPRDSDGEVWAVITTDETRTALPQSKELDSSVDLICKDMNTTELEPVQIVRAPDKADATFHLRANFEIGAWRLSRGVFNSSSWRPNIQRPTLHRVIDGLHEKNSSFVQRVDENVPFINDKAFDSKNELVIQSSGIRVIDLIVTNFDDGNHPLHLHGYKFFLMGQGHGYFNPQIHQGDTTNPLRRDTASVEAYGWLWIRVVADNPGAWPFHCHITWHTEAGLLMQLVTRTDSLEQMSIPQQNRDLCAKPIETLRKGGTPEDRVFYGHDD